MKNKFKMFFLRIVTVMLFLPIVVVEVVVENAYAILNGEWDEKLSSSSTLTRKSPNKGSFLLFFT